MNYDYETLLIEAFENLCQHFYDEEVETNAAFQEESGVKAIIRRVLVGETCQWCEDLAGVYEYGKHPPDVFRRHKNCDCIVEHITSKERTDVHTKRKYQKAREQRIDLLKEMDVYNRYESIRRKAMLIEEAEDLREQRLQKRRKTFQSLRG